MAKILEVNEYVDLIGERFSEDLIIDDGDKVLVTLPPGCWGPMITPSIKSGHEVSKLVKLNGAKVGYSIALYIKNRYKIQLCIFRYGQKIC